MVALDSTKPRPVLPAHPKGPAMSPEFHVGFLMFPNLTQLDLTGPAQVLCRMPGVRVHCVGKTLDPLPTDSGFRMAPGLTFADCPQLDVVCVPGGQGVGDALADEETLAFLRRQGSRARYVTSVCTGALLLGAAGLLDGYQATTHWMFRNYLPLFGARPAKGRVVRDRNRITGGGVTAGIDFGLALAAELVGEETARMVQLALEYDPEPPFDCGSPEKAGPARVERYRSFQEGRLRALERQLQLLVRH
jgi:cyclohexyl-isocyanide hydratase